jgi:outer membrane protein
MNINKTIAAALFAAVAISLPSGSHAQHEDGKFTLKKCILYSLENHPSSTIYANEVEMAKQKKKETLAAYLPQISGNISFDDNLKRQITVIPAGAFSPTETRLQFGNQYNTNAMLQLDQVIYDQTIFYASAANKANNDIAALNVLQNNEALIYNTATAYYQVLTSLEQEKLLLENEKKYEELLSVMKLQYEKGVVKKIDYDRVRVNLNNIRAQKAVYQTNRQMALNKLKFSMGMPLEIPLSIEPLVADSLEVEMPADSAFDMDKRTDLKIQSKNIVLQELDVKRKQALFLPTLNGYARYGGQAFGNEFGTAFNSWFDYSSVGLKLNIPIFSGMRKYSQLEQSRLSLINARENLKLSKENYTLQYQNAGTQLLSSYTNLLSNRENLLLAKDVFEATSLMYQKGSSQLSDFLNADYSYKESQMNYVSSLLSFFSARLDYEKSKGTLTSYIHQLQ